MSEQGAPKLLPCPFCGNKAEHRNTWVWCTNVSCRAHTAGFKPAEWNTRSDICAALVEALTELVNSPVEFEDSRINYVTMQVDKRAIDAARTAIAQAREEK